MIPSPRVIRVFPRRTNATPGDDMVRVGTVPGMFDEADEVYVSVTFEWDKPAAELLAHQWETVAPVKIGGPAYGDPGGEFTPGMYVKRGYVITSRGCPNRCWFCRAWKAEGNTVRELTIYDGYNVLDNNILACSLEHQERVFQMLFRQPERPKFTGGLEAARFTDWHVEWMAKIKPEPMYFAYDTADDWEPLLKAARMCYEAGLITPHRSVRAYVLIGYPGDSIEAAQERLERVCGIGIMPMAMLFDKGRHVADPLIWNRFQREWASPTIVGSKMR